MAWTDMTTRAVGYTVTAANWNSVVGNFDQMQTWTNYTPVLTASTTNPTMGDGAVLDGHYMVIGDATAHGIVYAYGEIIFGTSDVAAGVGSYTISLPITGSSGNVTLPATGQAYLYDSSTGLYYLALCSGSSSTFRMVLNNSTALLGAADPIAIAASDAITYGVVYRI